MILCIDVGPLMGITPPTGEDTPLEMSLRIASQIVAQKVLMYTHVHTLITIIVDIFARLKIHFLGSKTDRTKNLTRVPQNTYPVRTKHYHYRLYL